MLHFQSSDQLFSQAKIERFYGEEGRVAGSCSAGLKDGSDLFPTGSAPALSYRHRERLCGVTGKSAEPRVREVARGANHFLSG